MTNKKLISQIKELKSMKITLKELLDKKKITVEDHEKKLKKINLEIKLLKFILKNKLV